MNSIFSKKKVFSMSNIQKSSAIKPDQYKQIRLNDETAEVVAAKGGINYIQAEYMYELSKYIIGNDEDALIELQPDIHIEEEKESWQKALLICVAYLHRYKLTMSYNTLKDEYVDHKTPTTTPFKRSANLDAVFTALLNKQPLPSFEPPKTPPKKPKVIKKVVKSSTKKSSNSVNNNSQLSEE